MNDKDYLFIDKYVSKKGETTTSLKECDGQYVISQFSGINSENFIVKRNDLKLEFSIFKLNGIYYINLNGQNIIDYKKFINISQISLEKDDTVKICNPCIGNIILNNCQVDLVCKALKIMNLYMKGKISFWKHILYLFF